MSEPLKVGDELFLAHAWRDITIERVTVARITATFAWITGAGSAFRFRSRLDLDYANKLPRSRAEAIDRYVSNCRASLEHAKAVFDKASAFKASEEVPA